MISPIPPARVRGSATPWSIVALLIGPSWPRALSCPPPSPARQEVSWLVPMDDPRAAPADTPAPFRIPEPG